MIALLRAEWLRLLSRRVARIFAGIAVLIALIVTVRGYFVSDPAKYDEARAAAVSQAQFVESQSPGIVQQYQQDCQQGKARDEVPADRDCTDFAANFFQDPRLLARDALPGRARGVAVGVALATFLVGASFVGGDWNHGTMQALLFWEPRRGRVLAAKALVLVAGCVLFTVLLQLLVYGITYLTAATRGSTEGLTGGVHLSALLTVLRGLVVVSVTALLGYAVSGLARFTAASLGLALGYFVIAENLIRGLRPGWQRYLFTENVIAVLLKENNVAPASARTFAELGDPETMYRLTGMRGALTLAVYLGLLLGAFYVTFTRRDVT